MRNVGLYSVNGTPVGYSQESDARFFYARTGGDRERFFFKAGTEVKIETLPSTVSTDTNIYVAPLLNPKLYDQDPTTISVRVALSDLMELEDVSFENSGLYPTLSSKMGGLSVDIQSSVNIDGSKLIDSVACTIESIRNDPSPGLWSNQIGFIALRRRYWNRTIGNSHNVRYATDQVIHMTKHKMYDPDGGTSRKVWLRKICGPTQQEAEAAGVTKEEIDAINESIYFDFLFNTFPSGFPQQ